MKKKTNQLVKKQEKTLLWAGAQRIMQKPKNQAEQQARNLIMLTAKALKVSPFGVNLLGTVPYINKLGLGQKASRYSSGIRFKYQWVKRAMDDNEKAICECKLVDDKGKELSDWITGECSPASMKMGTLKGYQNHMAQTRAKNRAIQEVFGVRIHEDMLENIEKLVKEKVISGSEANQIGNAVIVSAEEAVPDKKKDIEIEPNIVINGSLASLEEKATIEKLCRELGVNDPEKAFDMVKDLTGLKMNLDQMTKQEAGKIITALLNRQAKSKK